MDFMVMMAKGLPEQTVAEAVARCKSAVIEPKLDGWRIIVEKKGGVLRIFKPNRDKKKAPIEYTAQVPELVALLAHLPDNTVLDGELVKQSYDAVAGRWINDFHGIQTAMASIVGGPKGLQQELARRDLQFVAFDALEIDGTDISGQPMRERYRLLTLLLEATGILAAAHGGVVQVITQMPATQDVYEDLTKMGMEGVVVKDTEAVYGFNKRGYGWFKIKATRTIDCAVMDVLIDGKGQHVGKAGRMVVGQWKDGELVEVAKVNCLNNQQRIEATVNPDAFVGRVLEVKIYGWDKDGPRHPTPMRFRDDKNATPEECAYARI